MYPIYMRFGDAQSCIKVLARIRLIAYSCIMVLVGARSKLCRSGLQLHYAVGFLYSASEQENSNLHTTMLLSQEGEID